MWCYSQAYYSFPQLIQRGSLCQMRWDKTQADCERATKWQGLRRSESGTWRGLGKDLWTFGGVALPGGTFERHLNSRPVKIAGERQTGFMGSGRDVWGRKTRKSAWSEESKRADGILGRPEPHWWDSLRQERPRLLVPICSLERPLPRFTAVPQYHLSAGPIGAWDKAVPPSLGPLNTAGGEFS